MDSKSSTISVRGGRQSGGRNLMQKVKQAAKKAKKQVKDLAAVMTGLKERASYDGHGKHYFGRFFAQLSPKHRKRIAKMYDKKRMKELPKISFGQCRRLQHFSVSR